jgi:glycosyltransferase involved in cell wall biosynthesis
MTSPAVALLYDDSAYVEARHTTAPAGDRPAGLVGRQVAGREFLNGYLTHGAFERLTALVYNQASADSFAAVCRQHPRTAALAPHVVGVDDFLGHFGPDARTPLLYTPCPPDASFAWARHAGGPAGFSLSGVTHTLCTAGAARLLGELLTAPYECYDALICTSASVVRMVRAVTDAYGDYLGDRFGGRPTLRVRLETIPLGVDAERFRPPTAAERAARRAELNVHPDAVCVLFVGRFTPHAKAHPFPMFDGLARAARQTGCRVHLVLSGWAAGDAQMRLFLDGLAAFAPGVPVSVVNGMDPRLRFAVWQAADVVTSLADSIQETFGLVVVEAMACGLPVVASDWDGYRDLVSDGETGLLVPTCMVEGATADATLRLLLGAVGYDAFLAECNQAVAVEPAAAAAAYARLLADAGLRRRMGEAGRRRVEERFTWRHVVAAYEELWRQQDACRREEVRRAREDTARPATAPPFRTGPACYPPPEVSFAGYPTHLLGGDDRVCAAAGAAQELPRIAALPLCNYAGGRVKGEGELRALLLSASAPRSLAELTAGLVRQGVGAGTARATLAWLLKYGLLRRA